MPVIASAMCLNESMLRQMLKAGEAEHAVSSSRYFRLPNSTAESLEESYLQVEEFLDSAEAALVAGSL